MASLKISLCPHRPPASGVSLSLTNSLRLTPERQGISHQTEAWELPQRTVASRKGDEHQQEQDTPTALGGGGYVGLFRPPGAEMGFHMCTALIPTRSDGDGEEVGSEEKSGKGVGGWVEIGGGKRLGGGVGGQRAPAGRLGTRRNLQSDELGPPGREKKEVGGEQDCRVPDLRRSKFKTTWD